MHLADFRSSLVACLAGAATMALVSGCSADPDDTASGQKNVLTTFTVLQDIAQNVAGDAITVDSITKPGAEIHDYEPTPQDVAKASDADLILDNGLGLERWFEQFVADAGTKHVTVSEGVEPIDITEDEDAGQPNPHSWMSTDNAQIYVDNLVDAFTDLDPDDAQTFKDNGEDYKEKLAEIGTQMTTELQKLPEQQRALVSCEGAFSYLARDAGLQEEYIWPVNSGQEGSPKQISSTIEFVKKNEVPAVFCESTVSTKAMNQVVEATDAEFGGTLYVDSLSEADGPVPGYLDLIEHDAETITSGLQGGRE